MRGGSIFILLAVVVIVSSILHVRKPLTADTDKRLALLHTTLTPIKSVLPACAFISVRGIDVNSEVYAWCRYILAPRYVSFDKNENADTVFFICRRNKVSDSLLHVIKDGRKVIAENDDADYHYYLTCSIR